MRTRRLVGTFKVTSEVGTSHTLEIYQWFVDRSTFRGSAIAPGRKEYYIDGAVANGDGAGCFFTVLDGRRYTMPDLIDLQD